MFCMKRTLLHKLTYSVIYFDMNKPKIYCTTHWSSYNRALIDRGNIFIWSDLNTLILSGISANLKIHAIQLTTNNVNDSQVFGRLACLISIG